jgi:putative membrane protein
VSTLTADEAKAIERAIARAESLADVQVVAALVPRADRYPEVPWRAFALGVALASLAAFAAVGFGAVQPGWTSERALLAQALAILGTGALGALATLALPPFARLFVRGLRASAEARQCAEGIFVARELYSAARRNAVLVLVAEFEHEVVLLPDIAHRDRVSDDEWAVIVARMTPLLRARRTREAFLDGIDAIEAMLLAKGAYAVGKENALPNALVRGDEP